MTLAYKAVYNHLFDGMKSSQRFTEILVFLMRTGSRVRWVAINCENKLTALTLRIAAA